MTNTSAMRKNILYLIAFAVISRFLINIKEIIIENGIVFRIDSYTLVLSTIMLFTKIIGDSAILALIPLFQEIKKKYDLDKKVEYTNNLINITLLIFLAVFAAGFVGAPIIIKIFGPSLESIELENAVWMFRAGLPIFELYLFKSIGGAYLQAEHGFRAGAKGGAVYELVLIVYLIFFARYFGLKGYMAATVFAVLSQAYLIYITMKKKGYKYEFRVDFKDDNIKKSFLFLLTVIISSVINQMNTSIGSTFASILSEGNVLELKHASEIISLFINLFVTAGITVIFPVLSESFIENDTEMLKQRVRNGIRYLLVFTIPVAILLMVMAEPIVKIFFERGALNSGASFFTSQALVYYALGLPAMAMVPFITRAYYSMKDMQTPIVLGISMLTINAVLNLLLVPFMGIKGVALASSLSTIMIAVIGVFDLDRKLGIFRNESIKNTAIRLIISSAAMIAGISIIYVAALLFKKNIPLYNIITVGLSSISGILSYVLIYRNLKLEYKI